MRPRRWVGRSVTSWVLALWLASVGFVLASAGTAGAQSAGPPPASRAPISTLQSAPIPDEPAAALVQTPYAKAWKLDYRIILTGYKDNYIITGFSDTTEVKFQFSLKFDLRPNHTNHSVYFGYTQKSLWNLYETSSPFVDSNYNPEISTGTSSVMATSSGRPAGCRSSSTARGRGSSTSPTAATAPPHAAGTASMATGTRAPISAPTSTPRWRSKRGFPPSASISTTRTSSVTAATARGRWCSATIRTIPPGGEGATSARPISTARARCGRGKGPRSSPSGGPPTMIAFRSAFHPLPLRAVLPRLRRVPAGLQPRRDRLSDRAQPRGSRALARSRQPLSQPIEPRSALQSLHGDWQSPLEVGALVLLLFGVLGFAGLVGLMTDNHVWPFNQKEEATKPAGDR